MIGPRENRDFQHPPQLMRAPPSQTAPGRAPLSEFGRKTASEPRAQRSPLIPPRMKVSLLARQNRRAASWSRGEAPQVLLLAPRDDCQCVIGQRTLKLEGFDGWRG